MDKISQITPQLYLGNGKHVQRQTKEFLELDINVIINCCNEIVHKPNEKYIIKQFPIDDGIEASIISYLDEIVDLINYYSNENKKIYVHCVQGRSRSASIVIYYLMKYEKLSFDDAYNKLLKIRPCIFPNNNFIEELKQKENKIENNNGGNWYTK